MRRDLPATLNLEQIKMSKLCPQTGLVRDYVQERIDYDKRCAAISAASHGARAAHIGRVCARFELESDEFYTAEQKAARLIATGRA